MRTKGPSFGRDLACTRRATISLPEPAGPVIYTRLPVGATFSIDWRSWLMDGELPLSSGSAPI